jgi:hypothetical protein
VGERSRWIDDLAGAILDGASIDWASAESNAQLEERSLLSQLRLLATVASVHRRPRPSQPMSFCSPTKPAVSTRNSSR